MARKKAERKPKSLGEAVGLKNIFNNEKSDFLLGIILLFVAVYLIIAMVSYLKTGQADQSILENMRPGEWLNQDRQFINYCGSVGAILSYELITINFGLPSFLIPAFIILVSLRLMNAYQVNLWKWFFGMALVMIWSSVTLAKFLSPLMGDQVFNPGGNHGLFCVQQLENIVGPPGLTALLLFVALAFLTYLSAETITVIRKALNPVKYMTSKIKMTVTNNLTKNESSEETTTVQESADEVPIAPQPAIDLSTSVNATENITGQPIAVQVSHPLPAGNDEAGHFTVEVPKGEDVAGSNTLTAEEILSTPINPREPFLSYKFPTLDLLKKYDNDGKPEVDMEEIRSNNQRIVEVLSDQPLPFMRLPRPKAFASTRFAISKMT